MDKTYQIPTPEELMHEAAIESEKNLATGDGGPFGAVIVKNGKIIGRAITRS